LPLTSRTENPPTSQRDHPRLGSPLFRATLSADAWTVTGSWYWLGSYFTNGTQIARSCGSTFFCWLGRCSPRSRVVTRSALPCANLRAW